jgi:hypothetical protein
MQHPVDAVAHVHVALGRLDVDVGRLVGDRLTDEQVDEANDRGVVFTRFRGERHEIAARGSVLFDDRRRELAELPVGADEAADRREQVVALGHHRTHLHTHRGTHIVDREHVARVGHREHESIAIAADRQHLVATQHRHRHERDRRTVDRVFGEIDERQPELCGASRRDLALGDHPVLEQLAHVLFVGLRVAGGNVEAGDGHQATNDEDL